MSGVNETHFSDRVNKQLYKYWVFCQMQSWQTAIVKWGTCKTGVSRWVHYISSATLSMVVALLRVLHLYFCVSEASQNCIYAKMFVVHFCDWSVCTEVLLASSESSIYSVKRGGKYLSLSEKKLKCFRLMRSFPIIFYQVPSAVDILGIRINTNKIFSRGIKEKNK